MRINERRGKRTRSEKVEQVIGPLFAGRFPIASRCAQATLDAIRETPNDSLHTIL